MVEGPGRGDKRARTRARLIQAAARLVGRLGYDGMSMEAVALEAGVTRQTVYVHFGDKDALILAVVGDRWAPAVLPPEPGVSLDAYLGQVADHVLQAAEARQRRAIHAASFELYALTHETTRQQLVEGSNRFYRELEEALSQAFPDGALPMPAGQFARTLEFLASSLAIRRAIMPEDFTDDLVRSLFRALGGTRQASSREV